jgi:hypothetical protein
MTKQEIQAAIGKATAGYRANLKKVTEELINEVSDGITEKGLIVKKKRKFNGVPLIARKK